MSAAVWIMAGFGCGALPFSVWLSRRLAGADARRFGDGNPGAANAWRAGGWRVGLAALMLDYLKGALPVTAAHFGAGLSGKALVLAALAPILGHAFSPLLGFRGGKGLTVTFGVWSGLTLAEAPLALGVFMVLFYAVVSVEAWAVMLSLAGLLAYLMFRQAEAALLAVWCGNAVVLAWQHRHELKQIPRLRRRAPGKRRA